MKETRGRKSRDTLPLKETQSSMTGVVTTKVTCNPHYSKEILCNCLFIDPHYKGMPTATATIPCNCLFIDPHYKGMPTVTATIPCNSLTVSLQMQLTKGGKIRLLLYCIICGLESGQIFFSLSQSSLKKNIFFIFIFCGF